MYKYIALCILAMIVSYVCVRFFCAKTGMFYRIMNGVAGIAIGTSCLFIWGSLIEIVKCRNRLKELKSSHREDAEKRGNKKHDKEIRKEKNSLTRRREERKGKIRNKKNRDKRKRGLWDE